MFFENIKLNNKLKFLLGIITSLFIIFILYSRIDIYQLKRVLIEANYIYLVLGLIITFFIGLSSSFRYSFFSKKLKINPSPKIITSFKSYFIASCFNLILPSKLGELSKGYICQRLEKKKYPNSIHLFTLYEKISDLFSIISIFLFCSLFLNNLENNNLSKIITANVIFKIKFIDLFLIIFTLILIILSPKFKDLLNKLRKVNSTKRGKEFIDFYSKLKIKYFVYYQFFSIKIWLIQIFQMLIFAIAVNINLFSISGIMTLIVCTLVGLLPISFAGIGTRDITLLFLLGSEFDHSKILILGFLLSTRYIVPSLIGLYYSKDLQNYNLKN